LTISHVPSEGRSAAFLGGVGAFEVASEAEPTTLRAGQSLEFRIKLSGPAAWGSERPPDLSSWASLGGGMRVQSLPEQFEEGEPAVRTFRYRIRPTLAGRVVLPPVAVASFDPKSGRFVTRTTSSLPILVEKPPTLNPNSLDYPPILKPETRWEKYWVGPGLASAVLALVWLVRRKRTVRPADPSKLAWELARKLDDPRDVEPARRVVETLTVYLESVGGRNPGVLTPPEAREAFESLTDDPALAEQAERLVIDSDRARYGEQPDESNELIGEARRFFERVAARVGRKKNVVNTEEVGRGYGTP
jgi:hypothetical protein